MENKRFRRKMKKMMNREKLKRMINDENETENVEKYIKSHCDDPDEFKLVMDIITESRLDYLLENDLKIDKEKSDKIRKKVIKITPKSEEYNLKSELFRQHNGKYKVETLLIQYHDLILKRGYSYGYNYGRKFLVEDIQNGRFTKDDIMNMSQDEIDKYCEEQREKI